jgi:hypothetical protein
MVTRLYLALVAAAFLTACSSSTPTAPGGPILVPATYEGVWTITYTVAECGGFRQCVHYRGDSRPIYLHLAAVPSGYEGVVEVGFYNVSVTGSVGVDGALTLTGLRPAALADDVSVEINAITLQHNGLAAGTTGGTVRFTQRGASNSDFFGTAITSGPITAAERTSALSPIPALSGKFAGHFPANNCSSDGWSHCFPFWEDTTYSLVLELTQTAGTVAGTLTLSGAAIPISGTATGSTVRFSGIATPASSGVNVTYRVETDGVQVDKVGRLTGTLRFVSTYDWHDGRGLWTVTYPAIPLHSVARSLR